MKRVAVIMGSDSDLPIAQKCTDILAQFDVPYEVRVISAHRTPHIAQQFSSSAASDNYGVIVCLAGLSAHLAGVVASYTTLPVIGVPIKSGALSGFDALLSTVMMPSGVPVATVAIDGGANAALLAVQILAVGNETLTHKLNEYRQKGTQKVIDKDRTINEKI